MVYEGTQVIIFQITMATTHIDIALFDQALQYVKNYAGGSSMWQGFPIKVYNVQQHPPPALITYL